MKTIAAERKAVSINPLKVSPALGAALAFLGIDRAMPLFHGGQGCTAFALVLAVRHFREAIPLQTTAMSELSTILGGADNVEQALGNLYSRARPRLVGLCSTALTETREEDVVGDLKMICARHPEWEDFNVVYAPTPDFAGGLEEGWARAVEATLATLVKPSSDVRTLRQVNLLVGSHLTTADVEELRDTIEAFGLKAIVLPDLSLSLDGHVPDQYVPTSLGGAAVDAIADMGASVMTLAVGERMRDAAALVQERAGVPFRVFETVTGLGASDAFIETLMEISGETPPAWIRRARSRLVDAMLDGHFHFGGQRVAVAGEPDLVRGLCRFLADMGSTVTVAVTATSAAGVDQLPAERVLVGDLDDLECAGARSGAHLLCTNAHGAAAARRLGIPLFRVGFPIDDRLGASQRLSVGYRGTRALIMEIGNLFIEHRETSHASHASGPVHQEETRHAEVASC